MEGKEIDCLIFTNRKGEICDALLWTKVKQRERYREMTPGGRKVPEQTLTIVWGGWEEASNASGAEEVVGKQGGTAQGWVIWLDLPKKDTDAERPQLLLERVI